MLILSVLLPLVGSAANSTLSIESFNIKAGETQTMLIDLNNPSQQVTLVELYMQLPEGLSLATGDDSYDIAGRTTWKKHSLYMAQKDGLVHLMLASATNELVSGTSGALISVRLTAASTFNGGTIILKDQLMGSPDMTESRPADYSYTVQTPAPQSAEAYAVFNNGTLTFYCDTQRSSRQGTKYDLNTGSNRPGWLANQESVTKAVFDASFSNARPTSTHCWFNGCENLTEIQGISYLNTESVTNMSYMFGPSSVKTLDVSNFNTANVTDMSGMFNGCNGLTTLDVSNFNTENVTSMGSMFSGCSSLTTLDVSNFNTENVKYISYMFNGCSSLTTLDVSNFNTANVTGLREMFSFCSKLTKLTLGSKFSTKEELECEDVFSGCNSLKTVAFTGEIPASINSKFFTGVGTASSPATLDVPEQYREHYATKFNGNQFFGGYFTLSGGEITPDVKDGDVFTDLSPEGVEVTFKVISAKDKTCQVGIGQERNYAIDKSYSGYVTIPATPKGFAVTSVSDWALSECALKGVTVPEGVKEIGDRAFGFCYNLETINLPGTLTKIENNMLWYCSKLKSFRLPKSVTECNMTFGWCNELSEITVEEGNPVYDSRNNCNAIIVTATNTLLAGCKTTIIPNSVKTLGASCFSFLSAITEMQIPEGVTAIGNQAFALTGMESVTIPSTVRSVGEVAFDRCEKLKKVTSLVAIPFSFKNNAFSENTYGTATLYVPKGTKSLYQQTDGWKNFLNIVEMGDEPEPSKKGDLNGDDEVNSTDLVMMVNMIMGSTEKKDAADLNGDGLVNSTDLVMLVNMIMGK